MKPTTYLTSLLFILISLLGFSQDSIISDDQINEHERIDSRISELEHLASKDPYEATKGFLEIKDHSISIGYKKGALRSSVVLVLLYYNDGDYEKAIEETKFVEKYAKDLKHYEYLSDVHRLRSNSYGELGILGEVFNELEKSLAYSEKINDPIKKAYKTAMIYESYAGSYLVEGDIEKEIKFRQKSIDQTLTMPDTPKEILNAKYQNLAIQFSGIALAYNDLKITDSAKHYFQKSLAVYENEKYDLYVNGRAILLSEMAKFYGGIGEYIAAIKYGRNAEGLERQAPMPYIRRQIYHILFNSYLETTKKDSSKYYFSRYTDLNDSLLSVEKESLLTPVKQILSDKDAENKAFVRNIIIASGVLSVLLILGGWWYWTKKNKRLQEKYESLVAKIRSESEPSIQQVESTLPQSEEDATLSKITDDTTRELLQKLQKFEDSDKYLRKNINLTWLANDFNSNTRYVSAIIKDQRNKTFNNYINGLRISYITHKLVEDPKYREYKIIYLAKECGYASSQVFVNAFKKEIGFTPSYFINRIRKDNFKQEGGS